MCLKFTGFFQRTYTQSRMGAQRLGHPFKKITRIHNATRMLAHVVIFECRALSHWNLVRL